MNLGNLREEKKVVTRIADWHEYHSFGVPVGLFKNAKEYGLRKAVEYHCNLRSFVKSELVRDYYKMWFREEEQHDREVESGEETGYYAYQNPVDLELRVRRASRAASRPLAIHSRWPRN